MAGISSTGIGSGLDVKSIVSQLVQLESKPLTQLQSKGSKLSSQISTWGTIKSQLSAVQDASQKLMGLSSWNARSFKSSSETAVSGSAAESAVVGSFNVSVSQLAQAQSVRSNFSSPIPAGGAVGGTSGNLQISLGAWADASTFNASGSPVTVNIDNTDNLSTIAGKINTAGAGVAATVISVGGNDQLVMRSNNTGANMAFKIEAFEGADQSTPITTNTGIGALAYTGTAAGYGMQRSQEGLDAQATIEGVAVTSASNTLKDAVPGLTLNLQQTTGATAATITIENDTKPAKEAVEAFVKAYNAIVSNLSTLTKYDVDTKTAGALQGDGTATGLLNTLKTMVGSTGPAGTTFGRLSDVGLELQRDGTLTTNATKLTAALTKPEDLKTFFSAAGTTNTDTGMARRFYDYAFGANGVEGLLSGRNNALQQAVSRNQNDMDRMQTRINKTEDRLYKMYSALDTKMSSLNAMSNYVTQQVNAWSNNNSNN